MIAVPLLDITAPGVLVSTNATNLAAYNAATTYAASATVSYTDRNWISVQAGNIGHTPGTDVLWWVDDGPVNTLAMFDTSVQTATTTTGGLTVTIKTGRTTTVGLMGLVGQSAIITVRDGLAGPVIYTDTQTLQTSDGTYYSWCFESFFQQSDATWTGLLGGIDGHTTIEIVGIGTTACGLCAAGKQIDIGQAEYGFSTPIEDRGRSYLDALGNPVTVERGHSKTATGTLVSDLAGYNRLMAFYAAYRGEIVLFIAAPGFADLVSANILGKITRVVPVIANLLQITTSLEISGTR